MREKSSGNLTENAKFERLEDRWFGRDGTGLIKLNRFHDIATNSTRYDRNDNKILD